MVSPGLMLLLLVESLTSMLNAPTRDSAIVQLDSAAASMDTVERDASVHPAPMTALVMVLATSLNNSQPLPMVTSKSLALTLHILNGTTPRHRLVYVTLTMRELIAPSEAAHVVITFLLLLPLEATSKHSHGQLPMLLVNSPSLTLTHTVVLGLLVLLPGTLPIVLLRMPSRLSPMQLSLL